MSTRPYSRVKDKLKFEFNPLTGKLDLVADFNADRIVTHQMTPFGNTLQMFDPVYGAYYDADSMVVTDSNGNVVVI